MLKPLKLFVTPPIPNTAKYLATDLMSERSLTGRCCQLPRYLPGAGPVTAHSAASLTGAAAASLTGAAAASLTGAAVVTASGGVRRQSARGAHRPALRQMTALPEPALTSLVYR